MPTAWRPSPTRPPTSSSATREDMIEAPAPETHVRRRRRRLDALAVVAVAAIGVVVAIWLFRPHTYAGAVLQSPSPAPAMDGLVLHTGDPADLSRFAGDVVLVYFGYTNCPDICPTTLAKAAQAKESMGSAGDRLQVLMVTVDPERDTPDILGEYVAHFDRTFFGVSGTPEAVARVASLYGIFFQRGQELEGGGYNVDHTGTLIAIDPEGYERVLYPNDVDADALAADLRELSK